MCSGLWSKHTQRFRSLTAGQTKFLLEERFFRSLDSVLTCTQGVFDLQLQWFGFKSVIFCTSCNLFMQRKFQTFGKLLYRHEIMPVNTNFLFYRGCKRQSPRPRSIAVCPIHPNPLPSADLCV